MALPFKWRTCNRCKTRKFFYEYQGPYSVTCKRCIVLHIPVPRRLRGIQTKLSKHRAHKLPKGPICEKCGFVPKHSCQLDVDHKNGIHSDDNPLNLQTLCANCHRLKTHEERNVHKGNNYHPNSPKYRPFEINPLYKRVRITLKSLNNTADTRLCVNVEPLDKSQ